MALRDNIERSAQSMERLSGLLGRYPRLVAVAASATIRLTNSFTRGTKVQKDSSEQITRQEQSLARLGIQIAKHAIGTEAQSTRIKRQTELLQKLTTQQRDSRGRFLPMDKARVQIAAENLKQMRDTLKVRGTEHAQLMRSQELGKQKLANLRSMSNVTGGLTTRTLLYSAAIGGTIAGLAGLASVFSTVISRGMQFANEMENSQLQLQFIAKRTYETMYGDNQYLRSLEFSASYIEKMKILARESPLDIRGVMVATTVLENFGGSLLNNVEFMQKFVDTASILQVSIGAGADGVREVARQIGQLYSNLRAGRAFGQDARILTQRGVMNPEAWTNLNNILKTIQDEGLGGTEQAAEMAAEGLTDMLEGLEGGAEAASNTISGLTQKVQELVGSVSRDVVERTGIRGFWRAVLEGFIELGEMLESSPIERAIRNFEVINNTSQLVQATNAFNNRFVAGTTTGQQQGPGDIVPNLYKIMYALDLHKQKIGEMVGDQAMYWADLKQRLLDAGHEIEYVNRVMAASHHGANVYERSMRRSPAISMGDDEGGRTKREKPWWWDYVIGFYDRQRERMEAIVEVGREMGFTSQMREQIQGYEDTRQALEDTADAAARYRNEQANLAAMGAFEPWTVGPPKPSWLDEANRNTERMNNAESRYLRTRAQVWRRLLNDIDTGVAGIVSEFIDAGYQMDRLIADSEELGKTLRSGAKEAAQIGAALSAAGGQLPGFAGVGVSAAGAAFSGYAVGGPAGAAIFGGSSLVSGLISAIRDNTRATQQATDAARGSLGLITQSDQSRLHAAVDLYRQLGNDDRGRSYYRFGEMLTNMYGRGATLGGSLDVGHQADLIQMMNAFRVVQDLLKDIAIEEERRISEVRKSLDYQLRGVRQLRSDMTTAMSQWDSLIRQARHLGRNFNAAGIIDALDRFVELGVMAPDIAYGFKKLVDVAHIDWREMERVAKEYGAGTGFLGRGYYQAMVSGRGTELAKHYELLTDAGGDRTAAASLLLPEIRKLLQDALISGSMVPLSLAPVIGNLQKVGALPATPESLKFGDPLEAQAQTTFDLLKELRDLYVVAIDHQDAIIDNATLQADRQIEAIRDMSENLQLAVREGVFDLDALRNWFGDQWSWAGDAIGMKVLEILQSFQLPLGGTPGGMEDPRYGGYLADAFKDTIFKIDWSLMPPRPDYTTILEGILNKRVITVEDIAQLGLRIDWTQMPQPRDYREYLTSIASSITGIPGYQLGWEGVVAAVSALPNYDTDFAHLVEIGGMTQVNLGAIVNAVNELPNYNLEFAGIALGIEDLHKMEFAGLSGIIDAVYGTEHVPIDYTQHLIDLHTKIPEWKDFPWDGLPWDTFPWFDFPWDGMPWDGFPWDGMPWDTFPWEEFPWDVFPWDKFPWEMFPWDKFPWDVFPWDKFPWETMPLPTGGIDETNRLLAVLDASIHFTQGLLRQKIDDMWRGLGWESGHSLRSVEMATKDVELAIDSLDIAPVINVSVNVTNYASSDIDIESTADAMIQEAFTRRGVR